MSHEAGSAEGGANEYTVSIRTMDVIVAVLFMATAALVMWDSNRIGAGWSPTGPEAGYFPFYVALIMFIASAITLVKAFVTKTPELGTFVERTQLKSVLRVFIPSAVYVCLIPFIGIYVASALYIGFFMVYLGKYKWWLVLPVSIGVPVFLFVMFEIWFLVPLPKGPLENFLGY